MPSTSRPSTRLAVLALSLLVSAAIVGWLVHTRAAQSGVEIVGVSDEVRELYRRRAIDAAPAGAPAVESHALPKLVREPIDEATAQLLFPSLTRGDVYDPALFYRRASNVSRTRELAEYPGGSFTVRTNSLGMREDGEPLAKQPDWRLLFAGASNVECVCANPSSAANLIEAALRERMPGKSIESLNAGVGSYNLYNDLAVLEHYRDLHPNVFVVVAYGGNDFFGCMRLQRYFNHRPLAKEGPRLSGGLEDAEKFTRELGGTEVTQVNYFLNNPEDVEIAIDTMCALTAEMERICRASRIRLVCSYLPPPLCGQPELLADARQTVLERLVLTPADIAVSDRIADSWLDFLTERGILHVDLRPKFRAAQERLYWTTDTHVNLAGQRVIADALLPLVQPSE
jgi:hypothetical protein